VITCTATFTPTTADAVGTYTITANYAGDTNYNNASSSATGNYSITGATPTLVLTPGPVAATFGVTTPITITATATGVAGGTTPGGVVTFTTKGTVLGTLSSNTCTLSGGVCTVNYTPSASQAVGTITNGFSATEAASGNYLASAAATRDLRTTKQTPTVAVSTIVPASVVYGSATASTVTATLTYTGSGTAPTGSPTFTNTAAGTFGTVSCGAPSGDVITCTATFTPTATDAVGTYTIAASYAGDTDYSTAASSATGNYTVTIASPTLAMVAGTPGTTSAGVTTTTLVATLSVPATGSTVTFTDVSTGATIGTATTIANGTATITVNAAGTGSGQSSVPSGGLNNFAASAAATANTNAAATTSNTTVYYQGILFSSVGPHDFSVLITDGSLTVEGTMDGTQLGPFGVSVYNFTSTAQPLPLTLTNAASGAFSVNNQCANPLPAGQVCGFNFYYAPPAGDGCNPNLSPSNGGCTLNGSGDPQGTFESAPWSVGVTAGVLTGLGNQGFSRSGAASPSGTLEGKAILAAGVLNVSPLTAAFGSVAQNATSQTITIVVSNTTNAAVPFMYTAPSSGDFTANNTCTTTLAANASCRIYLTMVTSATGSFSDTLTITPSGGATSTVAISGTVAGTSSGITLSSNQHNFGNVTDGTSASFNVTLTNNTGSSVSLGFSNSAGTGYTTSTNCGASLAASASCTYGFTFAPTSPGAAMDTLTITSGVPILPGSGGDTGTVTVNGTGVAGGQLTATSVTHNWGNITVGTSGGSYGVELSNNTSSVVTLSFSGLTGGSSGFALVGSSCGASLAVNANCELMFNFTPTATGFVTGTYPIPSSSPLYFAGNPISPSQITLKGTGD
jgi:trimeric autotransporter adhesin